MQVKQAENIVFDKLLSHTQDGIFVLDKDRRIVLFNRACELLTGYTANEVVGKECTCPDLLNCHDEHGRVLPEKMCPGLTVLYGREASTRQRMRISTKDGTYRWVETAYTAINTEGDQPGYILGVMRDISDQKEKEELWHKTTESLRQEVERLREHMRELYGFASIISRSTRMEPVLEKIKSACGNSSPVLISGENGTGKDMIARTIHFNGLQKGGPFVPTTIPTVIDTPDKLAGELFGYSPGSFEGATRDYPGLFHAADGGTLYIANIDALPLDIQDNLLRAIQNKSVRPLGKTEHIPVNVRVIAATGKTVHDLRSSGKILDDLFYRLAVITIEVPPLRARKEDIPILVDHFVRLFNQHSSGQIHEVEPAVWAALDEYDWPGNVRELQSVIETACASAKGPVLKATDLLINGRGGTHVGSVVPGPEVGKPIPLDDMLAEIERKAILDALHRTRGQRSLAAKLMGISRSRLYRRMDALGISPREETY